MATLTTEVVRPPEPSVGPKPRRRRRFSGRWILPTWMVLVILWLALHSGKIILAVFILRGHADPFDEATRRTDGSRADDNHD